MRSERLAEGRPGHEAERGIALLTVVLFSVVAIGLVGLSLMVSERQSTEVAERGAQDRLRRAAENVLRLKTHEMDLARKAAVGNAGTQLAQPLTLNLEGVAVTATPILSSAAPGRYVVDVVAKTTTGPLQALHLVGMVEEYAPTIPLLNHAVFANRDLTFQGPVQTQSYDGTAGQASASNLGMEGHIGANGAVTISDPTSSVGGSVYHTVANTPTIAPGATTGGSTQMDAPIAFPDLVGTTVTDARAATTANAPVTIDGSAVTPAVNSKLTVDHGKTMVIGPGTVILDTLKIKRGSQLKFVGDVKLIVNKIEIDTNSTVNVSGDQTVQVYYTDKMQIENGTAVTIAPDAAGQVLAERFQAYGLPASQLKIEEAQAMGVFYAPEGNATVESTATLMGTLIGQDIVIKGEKGGGSTATTAGVDLGLPGGHFDVDVWYRRADGTFTPTQQDYHEHQYDDKHNTDSFVFQGSATNGITGAAQAAQPEAYWSNLVQAQGANTVVELVLSDVAHASGNYDIQLADGTVLTGAARNGTTGVTFRLGDVTDMSVQIASLYELLGTEPGLVQKDPAFRGTENVPADPSNPQKGAYGLQLYTVNADGSRGQLVYEFRTYFHNKTGSVWPPPVTEPPPPDTTTTTPPPEVVANASVFRFDTSLRGLFPIPGGTPGYRLQSVWQLPVTTDVLATVQ